MLMIVPLLQRCMAFGARKRAKKFSRRLRSISIWNNRISKVLGISNRYTCDACFGHFGSMAPQGAVASYYFFWRFDPGVCGGGSTSGTVAKFHRE
ncbi:hypothetical protein HED55_06335 [Ochrobactrum haematophilum]|uniref:Secreted protein n=1 Tax=Brucella haematophila TaxID=419474 RepID=A0ABX1DJM5_9HYPH|nr:hypothetical protein [Brucella haematophila]